MTEDKAAGRAASAAQPEAQKPEAQKPEAQKPEAQKPEAQKPEAQKPEAQRPEAEEAPRPLEEYVGQEIRRLRKRQDMTVAELANAAGLSQGMLSKIENGQASPSLSTLSALAGALSVPISGFFTPFEASRDVSYVPAGRGLQIDRRGTRAGHLYQLLGTGLRGEVGVEPYLITLTEESEPFDQFRHAGVEFIHMLKGELVYRHGDQTFHLKPGDSLFFDAVAVHGPMELIALPAVYLSIISYKADDAR